MGLKKFEDSVYWPSFMAPIPSELIKRVEQAGKKASGKKGKTVRPTAAKSRARA